MITFRNRNSFVIQTIISPISKAKANEVGEDDQPRDQNKQPRRGGRKRGLNVLTGTNVKESKVGKIELKNKKRALSVDKVQRLIDEMKSKRSTDTPSPSTSKDNKSKSKSSKQFDDEQLVCTY